VTSKTKQVGRLDRLPPAQIVTYWSVELTAIQNRNSEENQSFWDVTPSGTLSMQLTRKDADKLLPIGAEFYLDFIPVPTREKE
jgi:hypothetical protein